MTRARVTPPAHTHRVQHPRMFSSSSSSSSISSSSSSCSLSPGPSPQKTTTTTTTITSTTARKRSSWMLSHHEKPNWEDTATATPFEGQQQQQQQQNHSHKDHQRHQTTGSCDQVVLTTNPHSPPSSPLPLGLHKQNGATKAPAAAGDTDSEDDQQDRRYKQRPSGRVVDQGRTSAASDYSSGHSVSLSARSTMQAAESATAARSRRKEGSGSTTRTITAPTAEIPNRPRFSFSTAVNPRPQVYSAGVVTREAPTKDAPTKSTATARSTRSVKENASTPRVTKSTASSTLGHAQPTTKSISSTTRISKSRSPTTITTTTTTTTRRVASTTITMGPHLDREHRKLAAASNASAAAAAASTSAHSTNMSSSSRKERMARAISGNSNPSPSATAGGATMSREGGRQTKVEPVVEHADAAIAIPTTTAAEHTNIIYDKSGTQHLDIRSDPVPKVTATATATTTMTTLLPPLQIKGEVESPAVIECLRLVQDMTPAATTKVVTIEPSPPSPSLPPPPPYEAKAEMSLPVLSSPIMVASSRSKTPSPPTKTVNLHEAPSSDIVPQTPDTPSVDACSPPKETTPIVQEHQEPTEVHLAQPPATVMATPLSKNQTSSGISKSTAAPTVISAPPTFLSGTPRIFRVPHETNSPCLLSGIQQQPQQHRLASQSDENTGGGSQERRVEVSATVHRSKSEELVPFTDEPTDALTTLPITLTATSILTAMPIADSSTCDETSKSQNQQQQPFRKNIWNGRMERFNKSRSTTSLLEEAVPITQGNAPDRTGLLAAMGTSVSRAPLTKVKDPAVMRDLMVLAKERRASRTFCNVAVEDGLSAVQYGNKNQFKDRSRTMMTRHRRNDNDNDTLTTTTFTTMCNNQNNNNTTISPLSASAPSGKITLEDKRAFLKTQETLRRSNQLRSRSLQTVDLSISSPNYHFPASPSPAAVAQESLTTDIHPGFPWEDRSQGHVATPPAPAMSLTIPLKVVTVLQGMGYPINNNTNPNNTSATSPLCSSSSPSLSPTWSTPSTPHIIPSSLSSTSISSLSSTSTASSVSSISSSLSSASPKMLPLSFPDRLFQARSPSSSTGSSTTMMPRSFSPRPVRATSITGASGSSSSTGERHPCYSGPSYNSQTPSQSSIMLPSLPSPALSLAVPERQRASNRSVDGYFKPRLFPGSRSEDEQSPSQQARQHTLRPFEKALVHQQQSKLIPPQRAAGAWPGSSATKSSSVPQPFPLPLSSPTSPSSLSLTDLDDTTTTDSDRERRGAHERRASTTSIDRSFTEPPAQVYYTQNQYSQEDQQSCAPTSVTQDISFLTKRLANLQLMDSLCPVSVPTTPAPALAPTQTLHSQLQPQQQQGGMDATWAMQIQLLLTHLAEQTDIEQESRPRPLPPPPLPLSLLLPIPEETEPSQKKWTGKVEGVGLYKQVLTDWLLRLDQLAAVSSLGGSSLYKDHPGLKREVEKIRWQHNVPSKTNRPK